MEDWEEQFDHDQRHNSPESWYHHKLEDYGQKRSMQFVVWWVIGGLVGLFILAYIIIGGII